MHIDCGVLEAGTVPTDYRVPGGMTLDQLHACAEAIARNEIVGIEIGELETDDRSTGLSVPARQGSRPSDRTGAERVARPGVTAGGSMIVMVTGPPASGKSTLASSLSVHLGLPLLSKDVVKEAIHESIGSADRGAVSRASAEVIWRLLPGCPAGAVVDMWLDPVRDVGVAVEGLRRVGCLDDTAEVMCVCPGVVAADRYQRRPRSAAHLGPDQETLDRIRRSAALMVPLGTGPALSVDATQPFDVVAIADWLVNGR